MTNNFHEGEHIGIRSNFPLKEDRDGYRVFQTPSPLSNDGSFPSTSADGSSTNNTTFKNNTQLDLPKLIHKWSREDSVTCTITAPSKNLLICGTQRSKIFFFDLTNYALINEVSCQSVYACTNLCFAISKDENYLFSAGSDSLIKIWDISDINNIPCIKIIYSPIDIGDIFSIYYYNDAKILFIGAQNASISWIQIDVHQIKHELAYGHTEKSTTNTTNLPHFRYNKFFDSPGPGGHLNNLQLRHQLAKSNNDISLCEISKENIVSFAHNGYIYGFGMVDNEFSTTKCSNFDRLLISSGGDGVLNLWGVLINDNKVSLKKIQSLENEESILSMHVRQTYVYLGLANGTVNVWDLLTYQLIKSIKISHEVEEVSTIALFGDVLFHGNKNGLNITSKTGSTYKFLSNCILSIHLFNVNGNHYLAAGGFNCVYLFNINALSSPLTISSSSPAKSKSNHLAFNFNPDSLVENLSKLVNFKTILKYPALYIDDSRNCTKFLMRLLNKLGANTTLVPVDNGNPIIISKFDNSNSNPKAKKILWYSHYDVVETNEEQDEWDRNPFELQCEDGFLYGRGVSDNKGPTLAAIYSVAELYSKGQLGCDFIFIIEGEEECGSIDFQAKILENSALIGPVDWILLSNSYWLDDERPCLNYGLRGVVNCSVEIISKKPDRHSGVDGGVLKEPMMDLIQLLNTLQNQKTKNINVPNFYDKINNASDCEMNFFQKIVDYNPQKFKLNELVSKWTKPSLTVHKIDVSGPNNDSVIPQTAKASLSIRIVPNQDTEEIKTSLIDYLKQQFDIMESENSIDLNIYHEVEPWFGNPDNEIYKILYEKIQKNWKMEPLLMREGGSIPSIRFLEKNFNAVACQIPCGQSSDNAHLKNERIRLLNLLKLKDILVDTIDELGSL